MSYDSIEEKVDSLTSKGDFEGAVNLLKKITDPELRINICYSALAGLAVARAIEEYGEVAVLEDKEKYERAKIGLEDLPPHAILYKDPDDNVHGLEDMMDFIPEDNPLKQYYNEIDQE